jgi:hypothetical protein
MDGKRRKKRTGNVKPSGPIPNAAFEEMLALLFTVVRNKYLNQEYTFKGEEDTQGAAADLSRLRDLVFTWAPLDVAKSFLRLLKIMGHEARGDAYRSFYDVCLALRALREPDGRLGAEASALLRELVELRIMTSFTGRAAGFIE